MLGILVLTHERFGLLALGDVLAVSPEAEQCGWLKDGFGVSWQVVPSALGEYMGRGTDEQRQRVTEAFLQMKKFDLAALERAFEGDLTATAP